MTLKNQLLRFLRDEQGQSTTEYILILSVVVMIALKFKEKFQTQLGTAIEKLGTGLNDAISTQ